MKKNEIETIVYTLSIIDSGFSIFINLFVNSKFYDEFLVLIRNRKQHLFMPPVIPVNIKANSDKRF